MASAEAGAAVRLVLIVVLAFAAGVLSGARFAPTEPERFELPAGLPVDTSVRVMASLHVHGQRDNGRSLDHVAALRRVVATCGHVAPWVAAHLRAQGVEARVVETLTLDEWNATNNGHVLVEARMDGRWVLFDVDRDVWFWHDGQPLSFIDYIDAVPTGDYEIRALSGDPVQAEPEMRLDDRRLMQVPMIRTDQGTLFYSDDPGRVLEYVPAATELDEREWRDRFYAE